GRRAGLDVLVHELQHLRGEAAGDAHLLDLVGAFDGDGHGLVLGDFRRTRYDLSGPLATGYNSTVSQAAFVTRCRLNKMRSRRAIRKTATAFRRIRTRTVTAFGVLRKESHASGTWRSNPGLHRARQRKARRAHVIGVK